MERKDVATDDEESDGGADFGVVAMPPSGREERAEGDGEKEKDEWSEE